MLMTEQITSNGLPNQKRITSDSLHNQNCYAYLNIISENLPPLILEKYSPKLRAGFKALHKQKDYDPKFAYADLYTQFFSETEENIEKIYDKPREVFADEKEKATRLYERLDNGSILDSETLLLNWRYSTASEARKNRYKAKIAQEISDSDENIKQLDNFILSIYKNDNKILDKTFAVIQNIIHSRNLNDPKLEGIIADWLKDDGKKVNAGPSPAQAGSIINRLLALIGDLNLQKETNLPTIRGNRFSSLMEYRFCTQAQRLDGSVRISPLFERWLQVQAYELEKQGKENNITYLYVNNLGLDRTDFAGEKERALTNALHELEKKYPHIAIITLPADQGLMSKDAYTKSSDCHKYQETYDKFLTIAKKSKKPEGAKNKEIKDFYISDKIRALLFTDKKGNDFEEKELRVLLDKSFNDLGIVKGQSLTTAQRQAVWFHFIKFTLTDYLIEKLKIQSINFSCKDAIDRGGVSSAYYNLLKSFTTNTLFSRDEFDKTLHAAPSMVKGRGMNFHIEVIWNVIDAYVNANYQSIKDDAKKAWLIEWRDFNCPHQCVDRLLKQRIDQCIAELENALNVYPKKRKAINKGLELLNQIKVQTTIGVSGKRLLLEATVRTAGVILHGKNIARYRQIATEIQVNYPSLQIIIGVMKIIIGLFYRPLYDGGWATFKAARNADRGNEIRHNMLAMEEEIQKDDDNDNSELKTPGQLNTKK